MKKLPAGIVRNLRSKLAIAQEADLFPSTGIKPETAADFYKAHSTDPARKLNYHALMRIMYNVLHRGWGFLSGVQNRSGQLLAVGFFIYSHGKIMRLFAEESPEGKKQHALVQMFDLLMHSHAGRHMLLDFNQTESSPFASAMGAKENSFYRILRDRRRFKW